MSQTFYTVHVPDGDDPGLGNWKLSTASLAIAFAQDLGVKCEVRVHDGDKIPMRLCTVLPGTFDGHPNLVWPYP
jgi:hypothetical protein